MEGESICDRRAIKVNVVVSEGKDAIAIETLRDAKVPIAKAEKLPTFEMRGIDGKIKEYVSPIYDFEARELGMVLS